MARVLALAVVGIALIALTACGECRVDGASQRAVVQSLATMSRSLDAGGRERFDDAIVKVTAFELARREAEGGRHRGLAHYLNGLTCAEIVELASALGRGERAPQRALTGNNGIGDTVTPVEGVEGVEGVEARGRVLPHTRRGPCAIGEGRRR